MRGKYAGYDCPSGAIGAAREAEYVRQENEATRKNLDEAARNRARREQAQRQREYEAEYAEERKKKNERAEEILKQPCRKCIFHSGGICVGIDGDSRVVEEAHYPKDKEWPFVYSDRTTCNWWEREQPIVKARQPFSLVLWAQKLFYRMWTEGPLDVIFGRWLK